MHTYVHTYIHTYVIQHSHTPKTKHTCSANGTNPFPVPLALRDLPAVGKDEVEETETAKQYLS